MNKGLDDIAILMQNFLLLYEKFCDLDLKAIPLDGDQAE